MDRPLTKPQRPYFSSGPTVKNPTWQLPQLQYALVGRSHRSAEGLARIQLLLKETKAILEIPATHQLAMISGSATGAMECLLWSLLGPRPVDTIECDIFSALWEHDIRNELKLTTGHSLKLKTSGDLKLLDSNHDWVFCWNGSTSGIAFSDGEWIPQERAGLTICDATSAAFAYTLPWEKLDAVAFSWQKSLGGEAGQGMIVLSPAALERLNSYTPPWPIPRLFRLKSNGSVNHQVFAGWTINTPSLLGIEDCLVALKWARAIGGLPALIKRCQDNLRVLDAWLRDNPQFCYTVKEPQWRSHTTPCFQLREPRVDERKFFHDLALLLQQEDAGFDFLGHTLAPPALRLWTGPTLESKDLEGFLSWLTWGYHFLTQSI